jgi:hypothetical protein
VLLLCSILAAWGDLEGGGSHGEGRGRLPMGRRGREGGGVAATNWREVEGVG